VRGLGAIVSSAALLITAGQTELPERGVGGQLVGHRPLGRKALLLEQFAHHVISAVGFYFCFIYVTTYLRQTDHIPASSALDIKAISIVALILLIVPAGALSDHSGRNPVLLAASAGLWLRIDHDNLPDDKRFQASEKQGKSFAGSLFCEWRLEKFGL